MCLASLDTGTMRAETLSYSAMYPNEHLEKFMALHLCFKGKSINFTKTTTALTNYNFFLKKGYKTHLQILYSKFPPKLAVDSLVRSGLGLLANF